jgi:hypothetical protein
MFDENEIQSPSAKIIRMFNTIESFYITFLVLIGIVCNTLSFCFFLNKKNNNKRSMLIFSVLALSDNGFLFSLQIIYLNYFNVDVFNTYESVCKLVVYSSYVSSFLSIWCIVLFNIERFITVFFPFKIFEFCKQKLNRLAILFLLIFSLCFYLFAIFTSEINYVNSWQKGCITKQNWYDVVQVLAIVDIFLSILLPFVLIFSINIIFSYKLMKLTHENTWNFLHSANDLNKLRRFTVYGNSRISNTHKIGSSVSNYGTKTENNYHNNSLKIRKLNRVTFLNVLKELGTSSSNSMTKNSQKNVILFRHISFSTNQIDKINIKPPFGFNKSTNSLTKKTKNNFQIFNKYLKKESQFDPQNIFSNYIQLNTFNAQNLKKSKSFSNLYELKQAIRRSKRNPYLIYYSKCKFCPIVKESNHPNSDEMLSSSLNNNNNNNNNNTNKKSSSLLFKIWRESIEVKRRRTYNKATRMILISSFAFLYSPMICSKVYNNIYSSSPLPSTYSSSFYFNINNCNISPALINETFYDSYNSNLESSKTNLNEIFERTACYLYYLNFVLNLFFYLLSWPKKSKRKLHAISETNLRRRFDQKECTNTRDGL